MRHGAPPLALLGCALVFVLANAGCTIRYSQALVGAIEPIRPGPVRNSDSGVALGIQPSSGVITFDEPSAPHELLSIPCDVGLGQVDYRAMFFTFYVTAAFPATEVTAYCVR